MSFVLVLCWILSLLKHCSGEVHIESVLFLFPLSKCFFEDCFLVVVLLLFFVFVSFVSFGVWTCNGCFQNRNRTYQQRKKRQKRKTKKRKKSKATMTFFFFWNVYAWIFSIF